MFAGLLSACSLEKGCSCSVQERAAASNVHRPSPVSTLHSESQVPQIPTRARPDARRLTVPPIFSRFQFSVIYTQLGATQGTLMEQQRSMLQAILKHFARELTSGVVMSIVSSEGRTMDSFCRLDRKMTQLTMHFEDDNTTKALVFADIERICSPEEVRNLRATNPLFIDECCTTVVLTNQRFVTFRLDSVGAREYLMLCLQVLRMSQDRARMWYS